MKTCIVLLLAGLLLPGPADAQVEKLISAYRNKEGVTVTCLNENLYGLYKKKNLAPEAENFLKELKEVNLLSFGPTFREADPEEIVEKLSAEAEKKGYSLVRSSVSGGNEEAVYARSGGDRLSGLIVIHLRGGRLLDVIGLKGNVRLEDIALLSKALNIKGLGSFSAFREDNGDHAGYLRSFGYGNMAGMSRELQKMAEELKKNFSGSFTGDGEMGSFPDFENMSSFFENMSPFFDSLGTGLERMEDIFGRMDGSFADGVQIMANSVRITEENGKTKIKIDTKNSDMVYIVDGVKFEGEEITMPEQIRRVRVAGDPADSRRSYLVVVSGSELGEFLSSGDGILRFRYGDREYKYDLAGSAAPLLWVDGRSAATLSGTDPSRILQIRPVTPAEKETGLYGTAEVFILTR